MAVLGSTTRNLLKADEFHPDSPLCQITKESSMQGTVEAIDAPVEELTNSSGHRNKVPTWIRDARRVVAQSDTDFFKVSPLRYWTDFLFSLVCAYSAAMVYLLSPLGAWQQIIAFPIAVFWLYRLGSLIHEVCHLGANEMRTFKVAWNLLVGVFTLTPSCFFTRHHRDHHSQRMYGTPEDPEYVANVLEAGNWKSALGYSLFILAYPDHCFSKIPTNSIVVHTPTTP